MAAGSSSPASPSSATSSPRAERGRYQGFFGGVFGLSTVVGPLLGGFMVDQFSWRWIFYINVPLGLAALAVINATFKPHRRPSTGVDRLRRRRAVGHRAHLRHPALQPRIDAHLRSTGQLHGHYAARRAVDRRLPLRRGGGRRSAAAAVAVQEPCLRAGHRHRLHRRHGAVRLDHPAARLLPGGEGPRSDQRRPAPDADDARRLRPPRS
ncbi:MAG: MFS transporter [Hyphomicrobium sp.]